MKTRSILTLIASCLMLFSVSAVFSQAADPAVKKSDAGICHDKASTSYGTTKKFEAFPTMEACLKSGGRAPANAAVAEVIVKKSDSGICHDKSSASYEKNSEIHALQNTGRVCEEWWHLAQEIKHHARKSAAHALQILSQMTQLPINWHGALM